MGISYIVFYAGRDIKKGEELLYNYGDDYMKLMGVDKYQKRY
jgi:SET domain-containing protein